MKKGRRFLAGFLAALLCVTTFSMDALAAASNTMVIDTQVVEEAEEVIAMNETVPVENGMNGEGGDVQATAAETAVHIDFNEASYSIEYGTASVDLSASVKVGTHNAEGDETAAEGAEVTLTYKKANTDEEFTAFDPSSTATLTVGEYTVKATYAGDETYAAAADATVTLTVTAKKEATPAAPEQSETTAPTTTTITIKSVEGNAYACMQGDTEVSWDNAKDGTGSDITFDNLTASTEYKIYAKMKASDTNHEESDPSAALVISTAAEEEPVVVAADTKVVFTEPTLEFTYGDTVSFTAKVQKTEDDAEVTTQEGELSLSYEGTGKTTYAASADAPENAGTYKVTASYTGNDSYKASTSDPWEFTIKKATPVVAFGEETYTDNFEVTATVTGVESADLGAAVITYKSGNTTLKAQPVKKGDYTVVAAFAGNDNYEAASAETTFELTGTKTVITGVKDSYTFTVGQTVDLKAAVKDTATNKAIKNPEITVVYVKSGEEEPTDLSGGLTAENVGTYTATVSFAKTEAYLAAEDVTAEVTVTLAPEKAPAAFTVKVKDGQTVYVDKTVDAKAEYNIIKKADIPAAGIAWSDEGKISAGAEAVEFTGLAPNTEYVVYARIPGTAEETGASAITQSKAVKTAVYAKLVIKSTNGIVIVKDSEGNIVANNSTIAPDSVISFAAIANSGYGFKDWKVGNDTVSKTTDFSYTVSEKTGIVTVTAEFVKKAALSITAAKTFAYTESAVEFPASVVIKSGKTVVDDAVKTITYYNGKKAAGDPLEGAPTAVGTYTAKVEVAEGELYKAAEKNFTFTIKKAQPAAVVFDAANAENYDVTGDNTVVLKSAALTEGQAYAVSVSKSAPKTTSADYQTAAGEDLTFAVSANKPCYVYTYVPAKDDNYIDSKVVKSADTILSKTVAKIAVTASAAEVEAIADAEKTVKVTVKNLGNEAEKITEVTVDGAPVTVKTAVGKSVKQDKTLTFDVVLKNSETKKFEIAVKTEKETTASAEVNYKVVTNYTIDWGTPVVKSAVAGAKSLKPSITLKAKAVDGKAIALKDCTLSYKLSGTEDEFATDFTQLTAAGIYTVKIASTKEGYVGETTAEYVVANAKPAKIVKGDVTIGQKTIIVKTIEGVEYVLLEKGEKLTSETEWSYTEEAITFNAVAGTKYTLYYRTAPVDGDDDGKTASTALSYAVTASTNKKLTLKSSSAKLGTITATVNDEPFKSGTAIEADKTAAITMTPAANAYFVGLFNGKDKLEAVKGEGNYTYSYTTEDKAVTLTAKFAAKTAEAKPAAFDIANAAAEAESITLTTETGYSYLVTDAVKNVTAATPGWKAGTTENDGKVEFDGLNPATAYYVYVIKKTTDADTKMDSQVSAKSKAVKTAGVVKEEITAATATEIKGFVETATNGKIVFNVKNVGTEEFTVVNAAIKDVSDSTYFKADTTADKTLKVGETAEVVVTVDDEAAVANQVAQAYTGTVVITLNKGGEAPEEVEKTVTYTAIEAEANMPVTIDTGVEEPVIVTYTGEAIPFNTQNVKLSSPDGAVLNPENLVVTYAQTAPTTGEETADAPTEVGVYTVAISYNDEATKHASEVAAEVTYAIKAKTPAVPVVTAKGSCLVSVDVVEGLYYEIENVIPWDSEDCSELGTYEELCDENFTVPFPTFANTSVTVAAYIPAVEHDNAELTKSDTAEKTVKTSKSSKISIKISNAFITCGDESPTPQAEIKLGNTVLSDEEANTLLGVLDGRGKLEATLTRDGVEVDYFDLDVAGTYKMAFVIAADKVLGTSATTFTQYTYVSKKYSPLVLKDDAATEEGVKKTFDAADFAIADVLETNNDYEDGDYTIQYLSDEEAAAWTTVAPTAIGKYTVKITAKTPSCRSNEVTFAYEITKKAITYDAKEGTFTNLEAAPALADLVTITGAVDGTAPEFTVLYKSADTEYIADVPTEAGEYTAKVTLNADDAHYTSESTPVEVAFTIVSGE